jgi:hypothetical protein
LVDFEVSSAAADEFAFDVVPLAVLLIVVEEVSVPSEMKQKGSRSGAEEVVLPKHRRSILEL